MASMASRLRRKLAVQRKEVTKVLQVDSSQHSSPGEGNRPFLGNKKTEFLVVNEENGQRFGKVL